MSYVSRCLDISCNNGPINIRDVKLYDRSVTVDNTSCENISNCVLYMLGFSSFKLSSEKKNYVFNTSDEAHTHYNIIKN
jgi:hypothetical protein